MVTAFPAQLRCLAPFPTDIQTRKHTPTHPHLTPRRIALVNWRTAKEAAKAAFRAQAVALGDHMRGSRARGGGALVSHFVFGWLHVIACVCSSLPHTCNTVPLVTHHPSHTSSHIAAARPPGLHAAPAADRPAGEGGPAGQAAAAAAVEAGAAGGKAGGSPPGSRAVQAAAAAGEAAAAAAPGAAETAPAGGTSNQAAAGGSGCKAGQPVGMHAGAGWHVL